MPSALVVDSTELPDSRQAAVVPPKIPQIAVGWKPRAWKAPDAAMPMRVTTSFPPTTSPGMSSKAREEVNAASRWAAVGISDPPFRVGAGEGGRRLGRAPLVDHVGALELDHDLAPLVDPAAAHGDDSHARVRLRLAQ